MIGFYVIMIAVLVMCATAGYTILTSASTGSALSLAYQNSARIEQNASALNHVVAVNAEGNFAVPFGVLSTPSDIGSRMILPAWVSASATTPWGISYSYCPYAPVAWPGPADTLGEVHDSNGLSHSVGILNAIVSQGTPRAYVTAGDARPAHSRDAAGAPDVLAFLISPSNNALEVPGCADVYWTGHGWAVDGDIRGSVRALTPDALTHSLSDAPRIISRYVAPGGAGTGSTSTDPTSLEMALAEWAHLAPARMTIRLSGSVEDHEIDLASVDLGSGTGNVVPGPGSHGRSLHLVGESGAIIAAASGSGVLAVPVDMTVSGVDFAANLGLDVGPGVRLVLRDGASVPSLRSRGGHVVLSSGAGVLAQGGGGAPVILEGGSLTIQGSGTIDATGTGAAAVHLDGAGFRLDGALSVVTNGGHAFFTTSSRGMPSYGPAASLTLNGVAQDLSVAPDLLARAIESDVISTTGLTAASLDIGIVTQSNLCANNSLACPVSCPETTVVIFGSCSGNATNVFLTGAGITGSGDTFTCTWKAAQGTNLTAASLLSPRATAQCAAIR